ncbi:MAG: glycosyltransferase family 2 protein [Candidatus Omnitrophica bacterium]|nr:glycosyltransferase family 2 protein [Candidatus Omnitrophota bacterium]
MSTLQSANKTVSVVIVTYGKPELLRQCLRALAKQTTMPDEVIVVDNGNSSRTAEVLKATIPSAQLILNQENVFFSRGQNQGIAQTRSKYVLVLNDDVGLDAAFLGALVEALEKRKDCGVAFGTLLSMDGGRVDSAGQQLSWVFRPVERGHGRPLAELPAERRWMGAPGAAALFRRRALEQVGEEGQFFDERLSQFYQDLDLNLRLRRAQYEAVHVPGALGYHLRGGTVQVRRRRWAALGLSSTMQLRLLKDRYGFRIKYLHFPQALWAFPGAFAYDLALWTTLLLTRPRVLGELLRSFDWFRGAWEGRRRGFKIPLSYYK